MRYEYSLLIRLATLVIFLPSLLYKIFSPLTIYPIYFIYYLLGYSPSLSNNILAVNNYNLAFIEACISPYAYYMLLALVMLTKDIQLSSRLKMLLLGSILILIINLSRIIILIQILLNAGVNAFYNIHIAIWLLGSTVFIVLLWLFLIKIFKISSIPIYSDLMYLLQYIKRKL